MVHKDTFHVESMLKSPSPTTPPAPNTKKMKWEIAGVIFFKIALIMLASYTIFSAAHRIHVTPELMSQQILSKN